MKSFLLTVVILIGVSESAHILGIFPAPSISHQAVFQPLIKSLAARGHHLTILTPDVMEIENSNVTQIDLRDSYKIYRGFSAVKSKERKLSQLAVVSAKKVAFTKILDQQLSHPEVKKLIKKENGQHFDVLIIEQFLILPMLMFAEVYDCPIIGITSMETLSQVHEIHGNEANPVIHPDVYLSYTHGQLTFWERWNSLKSYFQYRFCLNNKEEYDQIQRHFPNLKSFNIFKIFERFDLLMVNTNTVMGQIRPLVPNTIQLGFMHIEPPKSLSNGTLKTFLDNSRNGVIYMSLGSNAKSSELKAKFLQIFIDVFSALDYDVLWKYEDDQILKDLSNKSNIMISKWLPQSDLLAHPAMKLFCYEAITQGGQQSMEEAIDRTVPMIVIPFVTDQYTNANLMTQKGIGRQLDLHSLTKLGLNEAINEIIKPKYKQNIRKLKELVHDQPMTSREKAIWWTEYVIRHKGADHLKYHGRLVPFYQKYCLDFIAIGSVLIIIFMKLMYMIFVRCFVSKKIKTA